MPKQSLYTVGGTVQAGGGLYIARQADTTLLKLCQEGTFAYVLTSRQMGKSSLMVRTSEQLLATGTQAVIVDLSQLGTQLSVEAWYLGFLTIIADSLLLTTDVVAWWQAHAALGTTQRLTNFFQEVLLAEIEPEARVVIFVDEIDSTLSLPFTDDFYAAIRSVYNARAQVPALRRLSFVLIGVATPSDLIADPRRTPFNIGHRVEVTDFTPEEALPLADGLVLPPAQAQQVLTWVLDWTGGHPYLTQRLCRIIAETEREQWSESDVAQLVARTFFGEQSEQDNNLQFVRDMLTRRTSEPVRVLAAYRTIRQGRRQVLDKEQSLVLAHLKLSGVVRRVGRTLRVRNRIYETVFDLRWVREHWPVPWYKRVPSPVWGLLASLLAVVLLLGLLVQSQQQRVHQEQEALERETKARQEAQARQQEAEAARAEAERLRLVSLAQSLAAQATRQKALTHEERAALLARQAYLFNQRSKGEVLDQIDEALRIVLESPYFQRVLHGHKERVSAVAWSPDGTTLASASGDHTVRLWDLRTPKATPRVLRGHKGEVNAVAWSPDGTTLASAGGGLGPGDYTVRLWDLRTPKAAPRVLRGHNEGVSAVAWSPDGTTLASAGGDLLSSLRGDHTVRLWDLRTPKAAPRVLRGHNEGVSAVAWSPDGTTVASASDDGTVRLWALRTPQAAPQVLHGHNEGVNAVAWSPDGTTLASAGGSRLSSLRGDHTVRLWELRTPQAAPQVLRGHEKRVNAVAWSPDGTTLASASYDGTVRLWELRTPQAAPQVLRGHEKRVNAVAWSPDGTTLASAGGDLLSSSLDDHTVRLWELRTPQAAPQVLRGHEKGVNAVAWSPDGTTLASASYDGTVRLWDLRTPEAAPQVLRGNEEGVNAVAWSPDGTTLASASGDHTVRLWELRTPKAAPQVLHGHEEGVSAVAWSPDGTILASASYDGTVRLWDLRTPEATPRVLYGATTVAWSPDGTTLASDGADGTVRLWMADTGDLASLVCATVGRNLTLSEWRQFVGSGIPYERTCPDLPLHPSVLQEAQELARAGDTEAALSLLRHAITLDPRLALQPEVEVNTWAAQGLLARGEAMVRQGQMPEALAAYAEAQQREPALPISADSWNSLCRFGSLWGQAAAVLHACEQAVTLAPDEGSIHDSRGIARALTGDSNGAIADFQFFVTWGQTQKKDAALMAKRQSWIEALQAGQNPFDAATLEALRRE